MLIEGTSETLRKTRPTFRNNLKEHLSISILHTRPIANAKAFPISGLMIANFLSLDCTRFSRVHFDLDRHPESCLFLVQSTVVQYETPPWSRCVLVIFRLVRGDYDIKICATQLRLVERFNGRLPSSWSTSRHERIPYHVLHSARARSVANTNVRKPTNSSLPVSGLMMITDFFDRTRFFYRFRVLLESRHLPVSFESGPSGILAH